MADEAMGDEFPFKTKEGFDGITEEVKEEIKDEAPEVEDVVEGEKETPKDAVDDIDAAKDEIEKGGEKPETEEIKDEAPVAEDKKEVLEDEPEQIDNSSLIREEISKATDGQFNSVEEMNQAYNDVLAAESGKSYLEKINDAVEAEYGEGVSFSDLVEYKSKDFDSMDSMDVLVEQLQLTDSEISEEEIAAEMRPFNLLNRSETEIAELIEDGQFTQDTVDDLSARLMRKARIARAELKTFQESIDIDNLEVSNPKLSDKKPTGATEEEKQAYLERYDSAIETLSEFKFDVGSKDAPEEFSFQVTDDDRNGVTEFLKGDNKDGADRDFIQKNWAENGEVDLEKLSKDMYKVVNYERDIKRAYANGKSEVSKEVKDINNIDFKGGTAKSPEQINDADQAADVIRDANR
jgi:hypothetical protein